VIGGNLRLGSRVERRGIQQEVRDMSKLTEAEREIVSALIESKAVDFEAVGSALARYGPSAVLNLDFEDVFCGTMRTYVRVYRVFGPQGPIVENPQALRGEIAGELGG